jgi:hypothetical protein
MQCVPLVSPGVPNALFGRVLGSSKKNQLGVAWPVGLASLVCGLAIVGAIVYWALVLTAPATVIAPVNSTQNQRNISNEQALSVFGLSTSGNTIITAPSLASVSVVGIISAGVRGAAILSFDGKPGRFVAVGSTLAPEKPDATLTEVRATQVVVRVNGRQEIYQAPAQSNLAVLTSGVGKQRNPNPSGPGAAPGTPPGAVAPLASPANIAGGQPGAQPTPSQPLPAPITSTPAPQSAEPSAVGGVSSISPRAGAIPSAAKP